MSPRLLAIAALCSLAAIGCVRADVGPASVDAGLDGPQDPLPRDGAVDRPEAAGLPDGALDGGDAPDGRDAGDGRDGAIAAGGDARGDTGADAPAPTCSDKMQNSDETGVDCGGHCGKCPPGDPCRVGVDCTFGVCKVDHRCGECLVAADCPGVETDCVHRSCVLGMCGSVPEPAGFDLALQTSGDCKSNRCAADGTTVVANNDNDKPDDHNACTNDFCMVGVPSHTMLPLNSPCGGQNRCNASGQCVGCVVAADCQGTDTACQTRTCSPTGVCGFDVQVAGTRLADPTAGDCKRVECDGKGNPQMVNDDADKPGDDNPCTTDECNAGTPSHRPVASGTACGTGLMCDGANRCVQCLSASTCPGTDTDCHTRTCLNGMCGISNQLATTLVSGQLAMDCKRSQCDGLGGVTSVADSSDPPVDGNPCTSDICTQSVPSNPPLPSGSSCGGTLVCDGQGACVECVTASTCPGSDTECHTRTCINHGCGVNNAPPGTLLFSQTNGDCKKSQCDGNGNAQVVIDGSDLPIDGNPCTDDLCMGGTPSNPLLPSGAACGPNLLCNDTGGCVGCRTAFDCPGIDTACQVRSCSATSRCGVTNIAAGVALTAQVTGDCKRSQCDGNGQVTTVPDDTDVPVDGNACTMDVCAQGFPSNPSQPRDTPCAQSGGARCNGLAGAEACVQCTDASQCPGGPDSECHTRPCSAAGQCAITFANAGTAVSAQVAGDCKRAQCDGSGQVVSATDANDLPGDGNVCTKDLCSGSTPSNPVEAARTACSTSTGTLCDGSGACVQCLVASDCPGGPDTACFTRTCNAGQCGAILGVAGTALAVQTPGNCHRDVCDDAGGIRSDVDDTDVFVDTNACTRNVCTAGVASNPVEASGTACSQNGGSVCDGGGTCVQCLSDANCDSSHDMPCNKNRCVLGACTFVLEPPSAPLPDPTVGDCLASVCDGLGAPLSIANDADVPVNMNPCLSVSCLGGSVTRQNLPASTTCTPDGLHYCDGAGACL